MPVNKDKEDISTGKPPAVANNNDNKSLGTPVAANDYAESISSTKITSSS